MTGKTIYKEGEDLTIEEYLDKKKDSVIHFKAMVKHFGVSEAMVELPKQM